MKKMNVREFRLIVLHLKVSGSISSLAGKPSEYNRIYKEYEHGFPKPEKRQYTLQILMTWKYVYILT